MATSPHLVAASTASNKHLHAISYGGNKHLLAIKTATYTNKEFVVTPVEARYALYCYRGIDSDIFADGATLASSVYNGIAAKSVDAWQTGYKAWCSYYGRANAPSLDPANGTAPKCNQRSECCSCVAALKFKLRDIPSLYTLSSGKVVLYKPSLLFFPSPIVPSIAYVPDPSFINSFANFWTMHLSFASALSTPGSFYSASNMSLSMQTLTPLTIAAGSSSMDGATRAVSAGIHNLWSFDSCDDHTTNLGASPYFGYGFIPVLNETYNAGVWIEQNIPSTPLGVISANRDELWVHVGFLVANAFSYGSSGSGGAINPGVIVANYCGGLALKLTFNGG